MRLFLFIIAVVACINNCEAFSPDDDPDSVCNSRDAFRELRQEAKEQAEVMEGGSCSVPQSSTGQKWNDRVIQSKLSFQWLSTR